MQKLKLKIKLGKGLHWSNSRNQGNLKVPETFTMGHLSFSIRLSLKALEPSEAIFLFIENQIFCNSDMVIVIHNKYAVNGILEIEAQKESVFGNARKEVHFSWNTRD
jgi:hypothetical protein